MKQVYKFTLTKTVFSVVKKETNRGQLFYNRRYLRDVMTQINCVNLAWDLAQKYQPQKISQARAGKSEYSRTQVK